jgi:hypothetical protein
VCTVGYQRPGIQGSFRTGSQLSQTLHKIFTIAIIVDNLAFFDSSDNYMMQRPGGIQSSGTWRSYLSDSHSISVHVVQISPDGHQRTLFPESDATIIIKRETHRVIQFVKRFRVTECRPVQMATQQLWKAYEIP